MMFYPSDEQKLHAKLDDLMCRWKAALPGDLGERFVSDGAYPNYTHQRKRILYIGREAYGMMADDYIELFNEHYRKGELWGRFHRDLFRVAWGLLNRIPTWAEIPKAFDLVKHFGKPETEKGFSFAFINTNKCRNLSGETKTNWGDMEISLRYSMPFIREEITLLRPDIVISMNISEWSKTYYDGLEHQYLFATGAKNDVSVYRLFDGTPLLDVWHFSSTKKNTDTCRYAPVVDALSDECVGIRDGMCSLLVL